VSRLRRAALSAVLLLGAGRAAPARAQVPGGTAGDDLDDPKLARRLKTRLSIPVPAAPAPFGPSAASPQDPLAGTPSPATAAVGTEPVLGPSRGGARSSVSSADIAAIGQEPVTRDEDKTKRPILEVGYRRFTFVQLGAVDGTAAGGNLAEEPFDSLSLDFYPISGRIRFGLSLQYGWQSGTFDSGKGDYFIAPSLMLGWQRPGPTVTPFVQALGGAGYMRRLQFDRTVPTAYWQLGIDAGVDLFMSSHGYVSLALGYLHPVNGYYREQSFASVYVDTWSFKLGIGI